MLSPYFFALKILVSTSLTISGGDNRVSEVWNEFPVAIGKSVLGLRKLMVSSIMYIVMSHIHLSLYVTRASTPAGALGGWAPPVTRKPRFCRWSLINLSMP